MKMVQGQGTGLLSSYHSSVAASQIITRKLSLKKTRVICMFLSVQWGSENRTFENRTFLSGFRMVPLAWTILCIETIFSFSVKWSKLENHSKTG